MKNVFLLLSALLLSACATTTPVPGTVLVPTPIPCEAAANPPVRPALPVITLSATTKSDDTARAYKGTIVLLRGYAEALEIALDACK